jgi:hypothetical protein
MKYATLFAFILFFLFACTDDQDSASTSPNAPEISDQTELQAEVSPNVELDYEKLRIYPITASEPFIVKHQLAANLKNLKEAIGIKGFRISEKKPYGRFDDAGAVNTLTVQNKSTDIVYLMAGDVVQGGKQDRILAIDLIVPPRTITDIPVFCVEPNRWHYVDPNDEDTPDLAIIDDRQAQQNKKIFAFTGYYNVASNDLRKTMKQTNDQQAVWNKVGDLTSINHAESQTGTYANLENSVPYTKERNEYLAFFSDKFKHRNDVVGMIVVSGGKILGTDIFTHPDLFKKQYDVLIHSYITEAITNGKKVVISEETIKRYSNNLVQKFDQIEDHKSEDEAAFRYNGQLIHFTDL